jgi:hypothetical protein
VTHQIDAAMKLVEAAGTDSPRDLPWRHTSLEQLPAANDAVLSCRKRRDLEVDVGLGTDVVSNPTFTERAP